MSTRRRCHRALLATLALWLLGAAAARVEARDLHLLTSWDADYLGVRKLALWYTERVEEATAGQLRFTVSGPEAIPPFDQLTPTALGIFDLLFTHGMFHARTSMLGSALDAIRAPPDRVHESGVWAAVDAHYQAHGLKLIAMPVMTPGYQLLLRGPLGADCDLAGRNIRAAPVHRHLVESLGASAVTMPAPAVRGALAGGTLDGIAWPVLNALDYPWYEEARVLVRPAFGTFTYLLLMSLQTWNLLDDDSHELLLAQGRALEVRGWKKSEKYTTRAEGELLAHGVQAELLCEPARNEVERTWADGLWSLAIGQGGEEIEHLRALAQAAGITP